MKMHVVFLFFIINAVACSKENKEERAGGGIGQETYFRRNVDGEKKELENIHYARYGKTVHLQDRNQIEISLRCIAFIRQGLAF